MSSRALRKLQKEQELEKQLALAREAEEAQNEDDESDESEAKPLPAKPMNAFDMLEEVNEDSEEDADREVEDPIESATPIASQPSKPKKKKKKSKKKGKVVESSANGTKTEPDMDEIDRALKELSTKNAEARAAMTDSGVEDKMSWEMKATKLLAVDSKNLNPINEMKSLFGNIAVEGSSPRRQRDQQQGLDLGTVLTGRHSPASKGKDLGALATRRNVFMSGKEEWPLAASGGLSMEYLSDTSVGKKYNIIHGQAYQETQDNFQRCVESMEPQNLISLLMMNPYHIATLLQVSEYAKLQGDHAVSGDLIERALFTFGRSVHSTFSVALRDGRARVEFERSENRELYLSVWRYIKNLEMRGTWKTAFEWAKMLLQFNILQDPYGITLAIDQLALRGRQPAALIEMCADDAYGPTWAHLPNIQISLALAYHRSKEPTLARKQLALAMYQYPYILAELAKALEITTTLKPLWGKLPSTEAECLYTQLYITRAKDLWNTPEYTALLVEVAETLNHYPSPDTPPPNLEISLEEARHIMLLEIPHLIALLPRRFTRMQSSSSDVLPPPTGTNEFTARAPVSAADSSAVSLMQNIFGAVGVRASDMLDRVANLFSVPAVGPEAAAAREDVIILAGHALGLTEDEMQNAMIQMAEREEEIQQEARRVLEQGDTDMIEGSDSMPELEDFPSGSAPTPPGEAVVGREPRTVGEHLQSVMNSMSRDYYEDVANATSRDFDEPIRNPRSATVEDGEDDQTWLAGASTAPANNAMLRHADSDDDEPAAPRDLMAHPEATHTLFASTAQNSTQSPVISPSTEPPSDDPERIQRWLLSSGFNDIQVGGDLAVYASRLKMLRPQQQSWMLRMVEQRGGKELGGRVREAAGIQ